jgi:hypothetical protein
VNVLYSPTQASPGPQSSSVLQAVLGTGWQPPLAQYSPFWQQVVPQHAPSQIWLPQIRRGSTQP